MYKGGFAMNESHYYDEYISEQNIENVESNNEEQEMTIEKKKEELKSSLELFKELMQIGEDVSEAMRGLAESYRDILPEMIESGELAEYPTEFLKMLEPERTIQKPSEQKSASRNELGESKAEVGAEDIEIQYTKGNIPDLGQEGNAPFNGNDIRRIVGGIAPNEAVDRLNEINERINKIEKGRESSGR